MLSMMTTTTGRQSNDTLHNRVTFRLAVRYGGGLCGSGENGVEEFSVSERLIRCDRCQIPKPEFRYREGLPYWHRWCIRCEASPTGDFPVKETDKHVRSAGITVKGEGDASN